MPPAVSASASFGQISRQEEVLSKKITRFDAQAYPSHIAGQIDDLDAYTHVSERLLKKMDAFSHMALIASEMALQDAGLDIQKEDPNLVGIFLGNAIGGWLYAETELRDLYREGVKESRHIWPAPGFLPRPRGRFPFITGLRVLVKPWSATGPAL